MAGPAVVAVSGLADPAPQRVGVGGGAQFQRLAGLEPSEPVDHGLLGFLGGQAGPYRPVALRSGDTRRGAWPMLRRRQRQ
jgi:hypothetical protein